MKPKSDPLPLQLHSPKSMCQTNFKNSGYDIVDMRCDTTNVWLCFYQSRGFEAVTQEQTDLINQYKQLLGEKNNVIPSPQGERHTTHFGMQRLAKDFLFNLSIGEHLTQETYRTMAYDKFHQSDFFLVYNR